jgi:MFS family permease
MLLALVGGQVGMHAAMAGMRMAFALQALREGLGAWMVGLLLALFAAAAVLLALRSGRLVDRIGYRRPVYIATGDGGDRPRLLAVVSTFVDGASCFMLVRGGDARRQQAPTWACSPSSTPPALQAARQHRARARVQLAGRGAFAFQRGRARWRPAS